MKAAAAELARHIDHPDRRHRLVLLDPRRLRCLDCTQTVHLPDAIGSTSTSSRSAIPEPGDPRCPRHQHEHADACRTCAADAKADPQADAQHGHRQVEHRLTADVAARVAEARAALGGVTTAQAVANVQRALGRPADPERMAQARAELDALRPVVDAEEPAGSPT